MRHLRKPKVHHFKLWLSANKRLLIISGVVFVLAIGAATAFYFLNKKDEPKKQAREDTQKEEQVPPPPKYYSPLTGLQVTDEAATKQQVTGIMIENSPDARPQSGIKDAGVVYEAIAEGGITRFLCIYQQEKPQLIGPVRSVRPYYVDWIAPYDAAVAHIGGSYNALQEVRNGTYKDIDQFFNAGAYWRATDRYAPHNVYTSFQRLDILNSSKGYTSSNFTGFPRKDDAPAKQPNASAINVNISSGLYNSSYQYEPATNSYVRSQGGAAHTDREAGQVKPKVVIVIKVNTVLGFEDGWREQMTTIGSGAAYIFQDGTVTEGTWTKAGKRDQITFTAADGKPVALNAGQTWITAIPTDRSVSWQ